jgi:hypothetical protein
MYPVQAPPQDTTQPPASPTSPTFPTSPFLSEAETLYSELNNDSDPRTVVAPDLISKYEMNFWYHGVSGNPPKLMWRSDLETNPFPIPPRTSWRQLLQDPHQDCPRRLQHAVKRRVGQYRRSSDPAVDEGPRPQVLRAQDGSLLHQMSVEGHNNAKFGLNHPFNTGLGIPIARQSDGAQGTLTLLFKEMKTSSGDPSDRILALTNKHVAPGVKVGHAQGEPDGPETQEDRIEREVRGQRHSPDLLRQSQSRLARSRRPQVRCCRLGSQDLRQRRRPPLHSRHCHVRGRWGEA